MTGVDELDWADAASAGIGDVEWDGVPQKQIAPERATVARAARPVTPIRDSRTRAPASDSPRTRWSRWDLRAVERTRRGTGYRRTRFRQGACARNSRGTITTDGGAW